MKILKFIKSQIKLFCGKNLTDTKTVSNFSGEEIVMNKKSLLFIIVFFGICCGVGFSFLMAGGDFVALLTEIVNFGGSVVSSDGKISVVQSVGSNNFGVVRMTGGDYEVIGGGVGAAEVIMPTASSNLNNVKVYPSPYKPGSGTIYDNTVFGEGIVFSNLTAKAKIKIFNIAGELVAEFEETDGDGIYLWDTRNSNGEKVASGVYIYYITNPADKTQKAKGRLVIIR